MSRGKLLMGVEGLTVYKRLLPHGLAASECTRFRWSGHAAKPRNSIGMPVRLGRVIMF